MFAAQLNLQIKIYNQVSAVKLNIITHAKQIIALYYNCFASMKIAPTMSMK